MELRDALLESWDRQCRIVRAVASRVDESNRHAKPSPEGWPLDYQLAHIHTARKFHLAELDSASAAALGDALVEGADAPLQELSAIRDLLESSARAVRLALQDALLQGKVQVGGFDHPVFFLEHLVCHEGWHLGLIILALRLAGEEPPEQWQEMNIWGVWRTD